MKSAQKTITKKHLKTLTKNGKKKKIRNARRIVKYGAMNFARNIWLSTAATLIMILTLVILTITLFATVVLSQTANMMRDKIDITLFFKPETSYDSLVKMRETMLKDSNVKTVEIRTSEQEYENFLKENSDNEVLIETLEDPDMNMRDTMIATMQSTMRIKVHNTENLDSIKNTVNSDLDFVKNIDPNEEPTYDINQAEIATITRWANIAKTGGLVLSIVFIAISILVIFNTIRMAIFSRREEIYMMKLVGADKDFIRGPFIVEAQLCGITSGVISFVLCFIGYKIMEPKLTAYGVNMSSITDILETNKIICVFLAMIIAGILIGTISARLAVLKYMRNPSK